MQKKQQSDLKKKSEPTVVERRLGKHNADGLYWEQQNVIEIHPDLDAKNEIYVTCHEYNHYLHPDWTEKQVIKYSTKMAKFLWKQGYRKVKNK